MSVLPPRCRVAFLVLSAALIGLAGTAHADTTRHRTGQVPDAAPPPVWTAAESALCTRVRRKFWQAGEGWIVKSVSVCR